MQLELYNAIATAIATLSDIKHVSLWNNQFDMEKEEKAFEYPALFVEFQDWNYTDLTKGVQQFKGNVVVHLGFHSLETDPLTILTLKQSVHQKLQWVTTQYDTKMLRRNDTQNFNHDNVQEFLITYAVSGTDYSSDKRNTTKSVIDTITVTNDVIITNHVINTASTTIPT